MAFLIDGAAYFRALEAALELARRRVWIVGWDFDPDIRLRPDAFGSPRLGSALRALVEQRPGLEVNVLVWGFHPIYSSKSRRLFVDDGWSHHPRIRLRLDACLPLRGSHHEKLVCIDDGLAFVGGVDLTSGRWDEPGHPARSALRTRPDGRLYGPVHDVQAMLSGPVARDLAALAADRWQGATGERPARVVSPLRPWPREVAPDIVDCDVAVARTVPGLTVRDRRREAARLTRDALSAARRRVYLETQYLASFRTARTLAALLRRPDGPEILVVTPRRLRGVLERIAMGMNRDRLVRWLKRADRHGRLRVMFAVVPDPMGAEREVLVHSKVVVVDDRFARVGSSNFNNRSEGLDTECDVALEPVTEAQRRAVLALRDRLLAEHLDVSPQEVAAAVAETGSLLAAVDRLNRRPRGLRDHALLAEGGASTPLPLTGLMDPIAPFWPLQRLAALFRRLLRSWS